MAEDDKKSMQVRIKRVGKEPATCITYPSGERVEQWRPEPDKQEFEVDPVIARFAIDSGLFEEVPGRTKLKTPASPARISAEPEPELT